MGLPPQPLNPLRPPQSASRQDQAVPHVGPSPRPAIRVARVLGFILLGLGPAAVALAAGEGLDRGAPAPDVESILRSVRNRYATLARYSDQGRAETVFRQSGRPSVSQSKPFRTAFVRPAAFFFLYQEGGESILPKKYVVWTTTAPSSANCWWTLRPKVRQDSLAACLGGAASLSGGSSLIVPSLLLPGTLRDGDPTRLLFPRHEGAESIEGHTCHRILGGNSRGERCTLWIDAGTFLIRRFECRQADGDLEIQTTIHYEPSMDANPELRAFSYVPTS